MKKLKIILQYKNTFIILLIIALIYSLLITLIPNYKSEYKKNETNFTCKITKYKIDGNKLNADLKCKEKLVAVYYFKTEKEKNEFTNKIELGDTLKIKGTLEIPKNNTVPFLFNYKKYLYNQKVYYILNIDEYKKIHSAKNILYKLQNEIYKRTNKIKNNEYIYAYILGRTDKIKEKTINSYRTNGISHLFALSGLHVSIFSLILMKILKKLKIKDIIIYIIIFKLLIIFAFITGFSPSILRASILFFLLGINKVYKLNIKTLDILYLTFAILVLINPFIIYNLSFILSFSTTFFIILTNEIINDKNYILGLFKVSTLSFISNIGLSIYYFNYINPLSIIINLIFVPLITFIIFPLTILTFIIPYLSPVLQTLTNIMEALSILLAKIPLVIYFPEISILSLITYYIILISLIKSKNKKLIILLILILTTWKIKPLLNKDTIIYFIDVGQGDSILIITPHKKNTILIDTGGKINYKTEKWKKTNKEYNLTKDTLIPFMRKIGITKIDYLILTHGDYDHAGESIRLNKNIKIKNTYINKGSENTLEKKIKNKKIIPFKNLKLNNLDIYSLNDKIYNNENDNSIVLLIKINKTKILLMGDASKKTEEDILNTYNINKIDILKVGHHGSKTSTSENLLKRINPKINIISSGQNNKFGHPHKETLEKLKKYGKTFNTAENGTIQININNNIKIKTYNP
jgi:competence protein ComEC